jgi:hypothetical protein
MASLQNPLLAPTRAQEVHLAWQPLDALLQEKANRTQVVRAALFDLLTGQCDRHAEVCRWVGVRRSAIFLQSDFAMSVRRAAKQPTAQMR